jgi:3-hydroxyisobutyrate dehydrogenase
MKSDIENMSLQKCRGSLRVTVIGLGEVGSTFAAALKGAGAEVVVATLRPSARANRAAEKLDLPLAADALVGVVGAHVVLLAVVGDALLEAAQLVGPALDRATLFVDLTASSPGDVISAAGFVSAGSYIDVAINGAVSVYGAGTPLLAAGPRAADLADLLNPLGFNVQPRPDWTVGDASKLKLVRSVFAKGLELVLLEALLAAEAMNIRPALQEALRDYDAGTLKQHTDMYLRTHIPMAGRRLAEMQKVLALLDEEGAPTSVAKATIARYARTLRLMDGDAQASGDAETDFDWLYNAEIRDAESATPSGVSA